METFEAPNGASPAGVTPLNLSPETLNDSSANSVKSKVSFFGFGKKEAKHIRPSKSEGNLRSRAAREAPMRDDASYTSHTSYASHRHDYRRDPLPQLDGRRDSRQQLDYRSSGGGYTPNLDPFAERQLSSGGVEGRSDFSRGRLVEYRRGNPSPVAVRQAERDEYTMKMELDSIRRNHERSIMNQKNEIIHLEEKLRKADAIFSNLLNDKHALQNLCQVRERELEEMQRQLVYEQTLKHKSNEGSHKLRAHFRDQLDLMKLDLKLLGQEKQDLLDGEMSLKEKLRFYKHLIQDERKNSSNLETLYFYEMSRANDGEKDLKDIKRKFEEAISMFNQNELKIKSMNGSLLDMESLSRELFNVKSTSKETIDGLIIENEKLKQVLIQKNELMSRKDEEVVRVYGSKLLDPVINSNSGQQLQSSNNNKDFQSLLTDFNKIKAENFRLNSILIKKNDISPPTPPLKFGGGDSLEFDALAFQRTENLIHKSLREVIQHTIDQSGSSNFSETELANFRNGIISTQEDLKHLVVGGGDDEKLPLDLSRENTGLKSKVFEKVLLLRAKDSALEELTNNFALLQADLKKKEDEIDKISRLKQKEIFEKTVLENQKIVREGKPKKKKSFSFLLFSKNSKK